uniref:ribonucleoside-triphosphate reductase (thioredoxin) n=1 Tax=viral metagenome TaxID=1070528 RepID=A0A6C0H3Z6_9ZZZZ
MTNVQRKIQPVTQRFKLDESTCNELKELTPNFGFNGLGELVFRRTYSRNNEDWCDVVIRVVEGCMSIRKEHFHRSSLYWNDNERQSFARNMALSLFRMEWLPPGRGLWMMGTEFTYERGSMSLNNCFSVNTNFWTNKGLKSFRDFQDGDSVIVRGKRSWMPATVKSFGTQELYKLTLKRDSRYINLFTTAKHRWIVKNQEIKTTDELDTNCELESFERIYSNTDNYKSVDTEGFQDGVNFAIDSKSNSLPSLNREKEYLFDFLSGIFSIKGFNKSSKIIYWMGEKNGYILQWVRDVLFMLDITTSDVKYGVAPEKDFPSNYIIVDEDFSTNWNVFSVELTDREEEVWCVVEPTFEEFTLENGILTKNCSATDTAEDFVHSAEWTMDGLMNGVGVGFTTNWRGEASIPDKKDSEIFVIPDSREGWVESLIKLMCSYINSPRYGKNKFPIFDYSQIRAHGEPIKGFGGTASGFDPLKQMHERIESYLDAFCIGRLQCTSKTWKEFKSEDLEQATSEWREVEVEVDKPYSHTRLVADVFNAIGACVVAGNVRRSAEISLGYVDDKDFMNLKNYEINPERSAIGWLSNNSVVLRADNGYKDFSYIPELARRILDNGEPGMINLYNIQKYGRSGKELPDEATMVNPCAEIALSNWELCNLSEVFPPRCSDPEKFYKGLEYATFYASTVSLLPTHRPETNAVIAKNRRIGVSISGIAQWASKSDSEEWGQMNYTKMITFLRKGYKVVRETNTRLAKEAGVPAAVRVTTVKPSGSISLLAGCTPGVHYPVSRYAIRRVRIGMTSPLVEPLIAAGVPHEKDIVSENTYVFEFVIDHGDVRPCEDVSPWEQFSVVQMMQKHYADNCVSATIYFDKEKDGPEVESMLAMFIPNLKSVSMLPHSGHGYAQAPYEKISLDEYNRRKNEFKPIDYKSVKNNVPSGSKFCSGDTCEL